MKRQRKGLRTTQYNTKEKLEVIDMKQYIHPPVERENMNQIFTSIRKSRQERRDDLHQQYRKFPHQKY